MWCLKQVLLLLWLVNHTWILWQNWLRAHVYCEGIWRHLFLYLLHWLEDVLICRTYLHVGTFSWKLAAGFFVGRLTAGWWNLLDSLPWINWIPCCSWVLQGFIVLTCSKFQSSMSCLLYNDHFMMVGLFGYQSCLEVGYWNVTWYCLEGFWRLTDCTVCCWIFFWLLHCLDVLYWAAELSHLNSCDILYSPS